MEVWVEKYRPRELSDIVGNNAALEKLRGMAHDGNMPNLILSGPPGCGKTTSVLALARALLGDAYGRDTVLELNASDDRGIDVVRNKIKGFAQQQAKLPPGRHKLVILDEADSMTEGAQQAMRRTIEMFSITTRFALACNQSTKIIEPLQSRCGILRFGKLSDSDIVNRLQVVAREEGVAMTDEGLEALVFTAEGDLRNAINNLQSVFNGFGTVNWENVFKVCDQPHPEALRRVLEGCVKQDWNSAYDIFASLFAQGYAWGDLIASFVKVMKASESLREDVRLEFLKETTLYQVRVAKGCGSIVQLGGLVAKLCEVSIKAGLPQGKMALMSGA